MVHTRGQVHNDVVRTQNASGTIHFVQNGELFVEIFVSSLRSFSVWVTFQGKKFDSGDRDFYRGSPSHKLLLPGLTQAAGYHVDLLQ